MSSFTVDNNLLINASTVNDGEQTLLEEIRNRLNELNMRTLYIRKLPRSTSLSQLKAMCRTSTNGRLVKLSRNPHYRLAFVEYKSHDLAMAGLKSLDGKLFGGVSILVELCSERCKLPSNNWRLPQTYQLDEFNLNRLYVAGINRQSNEQEIRDLFPKAKSFDFLTAENPSVLWHCRVTFESQEDALEGFRSRHGTILYNTPIIVNFDLKKCKPSVISVSKCTTNTSTPLTTADAQLRENVNMKQRKKSAVSSPALAKSSTLVEITSPQRIKHKKKKLKKKLTAGTTQSSSPANIVSKPSPKKRKLRYSEI
ncbi:unnamed protein product [Heterobilharzia americana]|nr:unnamed protein product [Heterobilharzia americana]